MKSSPILAAYCLVAFQLASLANLASAFAEPGSAASSDDNDEARRLYRSGVAAFDADKPEAARVQLAKAWSIRRTYDVASVLGQVELALNRPRDAAEHLDFAIRNFPPQLSAEALERVRGTFSQAEKRVGTLLIRVDRDGAKLLVDDQPVGTSPLPGPIFLDPGAHTVEAEQGGKRVSRTVNAEAGATQSLGLNFGESSRSASQPTASEGSSLRPIALVAGGTLVLVGSALGVGFAVGAAGARDRADDLRVKLTDGACHPGSGASQTCAALRAASEDHDQYRNIAAVSFAVAGSALIATTAYWIFGGRDSARDARSGAGLELGASVTNRQGAVWCSGAF